MIADILKNKNLYKSISPRIEKALEYIASTDFLKIEAGKYELDGANLFVLIQEYDTLQREQCKWESHQKYIDIQYLAEGIEQIGVNNIGQMQVTVEYNPEKDIAFLDGDGDYVTFSKGSYGIFFPEDAHQPRVAPENIPGKVKKSCC